MFCLKDFTDFPAGTAITVDPKHDFKPGDLSSLLKKMRQLDSSLTAADPSLDRPAAGSLYYILSTTTTTVTVGTEER